ncbi:MAG TPA: tetratricopeptide repeat protein [Spirochaetales bacterium]|nr:tetratricopeptide repeat protein [Spirochaetales bacterium]
MRTPPTHRVVRKAILAPWLVAAMALSAPDAAAAPSGLVTLTASPMVTVPITSGDFGPNDGLAAAFGGSLGLEYALPTRFPLALRLSGGFSSGGLLPVDGVEVAGRLSELSVLAGAGTGLALRPSLRLRGFLDGGMAIGRLDSGDGVPYASARAGTGLELDLAEGFSARLDAAWTYMSGLYGGFGATLGVAYALPAPGSGGDRLLEFASADLGEVFPIFRSYYDDNPIGTVRINNASRKTARDVKVSFVIRQYMDAPKECAVIERLAPGKSVDVPIYGLFNDSILSVTEATKAGAEITVEYGSGTTQTKTVTVVVYDRNALTWVDDRHAAAFVSSKDPWVLDLSGNISAAVKDSRNPELPDSVQSAVAFHEGLRVYGISYVLSPNRPFATGAVDAAAVDSLKFPRQTLGYRAGDCADLTVLYASFFEAAGIQTAFITVPGHIFVAFDSGLSVVDAAARSMDERELVVIDGRVWIPIETTMRDSGFVEAWRAAARQWREARSGGAAGFHPVHEAWKTFPPVGLPADGSSAAPPSAKAVKTAFVAELDRLVSLELKARLERLGPRPTSGAARFLNERGVLYARYGRYDDAERDLRAAAKDQYQPAIVNLGNVAFLRGDYKAAYDRFDQAAEDAPDNARLIVSMARTAAALGRSDEVAALIARVRAIDPATADRYASLVGASASGTRAAQAGKEETIWF